MNKEVFFGEKGLTSTSANHICNIAKEWYLSKEQEIQNIIGYNTYVKVLGTETYDLVAKGEFNIKLEQTLKEISEAKALTAWLREAIKARENLVKEVKSKEIEHIPQPEKGHILTEEEYYASLSVDNRLRYYSLEAECATLGKYIHPDGKINNLRKNLKDLPPVSLDKENDSIILVYKYEKTIKEEDLDNIFFQLQNKYRELQAQLNKYKYNCQKAIEESQIKVDSEYFKAYSEWSLDTKNKVNELIEWKNKEIKRIGDLKIIIPKSLESIYQKINNLGKEGEK